MTDSNRIPIKKTGKILAIACVTFAAVATMLYSNYQIAMIDYSAPVVIGTVVVILSCAALQRLFCSRLIRNSLYFSFGCKNSYRTEAVTSKTESDKHKKLPQTDNPVAVSQQICSYLENYDARLKELEQAKREKRAAIVQAIHDYTTYTMAEFLSKENLATLHENIEYLALCQTDLFKPVRSMQDNPIKPPALRHFAWNIGERLDIPLIDRARFIKTVFPHELENATIEYLCKNLRDSIPARIAIDIPVNGDYHFSCMKNSTDSNN